MIKKLFHRVQKLVLTPEEYGRKKGVRIGNNCSIMTKNFGSEPYLISIGDNVQITKSVSFFTHGGAWVIRKDIPNFDFFGKIIIKDNVYVGNNVLILPGVTIEDNVIIGAGSVVTKSIPKGMIVAGNPATIIGASKDFKEKMTPYNIGTKNYTTKEKENILKNLTDEKFISKKFIEVK